MPITVRFLLSISPLVMAVVLVGCGLTNRATSETSSEPISRQSELTIGVTSSQPQIGTEARTGVYEGFDVDVATYLARALGFERSERRIVAAPPGKRVRMLRRGDVDMVVAAFPVTPKDKVRVQFAGPYFVARQDIVVRAGNTEITSVRQLHQRPVCAARGTGAFAPIRALDIQPDRRTGRSWPDCLLQLKVGQVDAVTASDATIAGYMRYRSRNLRLVGAPFAEERWGVGLRKQDVSACEKLNRAIVRMYADGAAVRMQNEWFGGTGLRRNRSVPQFEGCG